MAFTPKDWHDSPATDTPLSAASQEDQEARLSTYTDSAVAAAIAGIPGPTSPAGTAALRQLGGGATQAAAGNDPRFGQVFNVKAAPYNAAGNGSTNDTTAIQTAINDARDAGGGVVLFPKGTYMIASVLTVTGNNIHLLGQRATIKKSGSTHMIDVGSLTTWRNTAQANTLSANATAGSTTITLTAGKGANITAGTWILVVSTDLAAGTGHSQKRSEFAYVESKATDTLTLAAPLRSTYNTTATAEVQNLTWITGFRLEGLEFDGDMQTSGSVNNDNGVYLVGCYEPTIVDIRGKRFVNWFLGLQGCLNANVRGLRAIDQLSDGVNGNTGSFGYSIVELDINEGLTVEDLHAERTRHAYTTAGFTLGVGTPTSSRISNSTAFSMRGAGFDTHEPGSDISFSHCVVQGSQRGGFQARCVATQLYSCEARDTLGPGLLVDLEASETYVSSLFLRRTNHGAYDGVSWYNRAAVYDRGQRTVIDGARVRDAGGPAVQIAGAGDHGRYRNVEVLNPCQHASNTEQWAFGALSGGSEPSAVSATKLYIRDCHVEDTTGQVLYAYRLTQATLDGTVIDSTVVGNGITAPYSFAGNVSLMGGSKAFSGAPGARGDVTLASDAFSVDDLTITGPFLNVNGEGGLADNLATINGGVEGQEIRFRRTSPNITVKSGTGNIQLNGAVDFVLNSSYDNLTLVKLGSNWLEVARMAN